MKRLRCAVRVAAALVAIACLPPKARPNRVARVSTTEAPHCAWSVSPRTLRRVADTVYLAWMLPRPLPEATQPADAPALAELRRTIDMALARAGLSSDPRVLLERQRGYWANRATAVERLEAANGEAVLAGSAGTLRPIGCLESLLIEAQLERFPATGARSEMHAFVLTRESATAHPEEPSEIVYFAASSAPFPPRPGPLLDSIAAREAEGWRLAADIHNHPFYLDRLGSDSRGQPLADIAGATAPSTSDVQFYRFLRERFGLQRALLTNGFTTLVLPTSAFGRLYERADTSRMHDTPHP